VTEPLDRAEERLIAYYTEQISARQRSNKLGRRVLWIIGAIVVLIMFLCGGLVPALFTSDQQSGSNSATALSCGVRLADVPLPNLDPGKLSAEQVQNVGTIVQVGQRMSVPPRGWVVAVATGLQESKLRNLHNLGARNDHDSLGIFQQRPSQGWGTEDQVLDTGYAAGKFYEHLLQVPDWQTKQLTEAAQAVQRSAFPSAYAKWEPLATHLVLQVTGSESSAPPSTGVSGSPSPEAPPSASTPSPQDAVKALQSCAAPGELSGSGWIVPLRGHVGSGFRTPDRPDHQGVDIVAPRGSTIRAAGPGVVTVSTCNASTGNCDVDGGLSVKGCGWYVEIDHGGGLLTRYCHMTARPVVAVGQRVAAGDPLGAVGSSGNSTGPHLHFESRINGQPVDPTAFLGVRGVSLDGKNT
jgi:murein DD-endopeptidase MepM/ murein hydrolase activator NlpD